MVDGAISKNIFLVNAPAGSGKTTWIKKKIENHLFNYMNDNILCITYTNRAADELGKDLDGNRVYCGTIHGFIKYFMKSFFSHSSIIDLYLDTYKDKILERIDNVEQNTAWLESNEKYKEEYGSLDLVTIRSNIKSISYNETSFDSLYTGALGHDSLISFSKLAVEKFPIIKRKISNKYQIIFIDEYQDAAADVLSIFYTSVFGRTNELYLVGDKMQQIYRNYTGEFEEQFKLLNKSIKLSTNYRTTPKIVNILNAIYNDENYNQCPYEKNKDNSMDFLPQVQFVSDVEKTIFDIRQKYNDALVLYLYNKSRFYAIGIGELYDGYNKMEKYGFEKKHNAVDILINDVIRENDSLMSFLFFVYQLLRNYEQEYYGQVLKIIHKSDKYCESSNFIIRIHKDKSTIKSKLDIIKNSFNNLEVSIDDFLSICNENGFIKSDLYSDIIEDVDYQYVKTVMINEVKLLAVYLENPKISTQHGVKGESHNTVVFVAQDSTTNPVVHMSKFFELWSNISITLEDFDSFYYSYKRMLESIENKIGVKCTKLNTDTYEKYKNELESILESFRAINNKNPYYINLLDDKVSLYYKKRNVTSIKDCLKEGNVYGPLCAYRLFYVGCSRSRKNLIIVIKKENVEKFKEKLCQKFVETGFEIL